MKNITIIAFTLIMVVILMSCNTKTVNNEHVENKEHENHSPKGMVLLNKNQQDALSLKLGTFQMRNLTTVVKTNGELEVPPANTAEITAIIGGNVKKIKVFHGDKIYKGQVLAILEHSNYIKVQEDFAEVAHGLDFLKQDYERQKELYENNVGAGKVLQKVKSDYNIAKAKYEGLKSRLKLLNIDPQKIKNGTITNTIAIYSPINGFVNEVNIKLGTYVDAKDKMFEITDNNEIHADFMVYEKDIHLIKEGQKIHFTVANRPDEEFIATIFAIGKEFEKNTRAIHIHAKLNKRVEGLIPGMFITGHIHTDERLTQTLPEDAVVKEGTKSFIFVLNNKEDHYGTADDHDHEYSTGEDHDEQTDESIKIFKMVEVITGQKAEGYTEIKLIDSLPEDTKIVLNAAYYLLADMKKDETEHEH